MTEPYDVSMNEEEVVGYGVLIRHPGSIDQLLPAAGNAHYSTDTINHWRGSSNPEPMSLATKEAAQSLADELTAKFGADKWRFTVAARRLTPRWFIADPKHSREGHEIGKYEQIPLS